MTLIADARHLPIANGTVQACVTSPPYFALRDYGTAGQIGQEDTPDAYVQALVAVGREVWRVLRDDGTFWLNLGDSYATRGGENRGKAVICRSKPVPRGGARWGGGNAVAVGVVKPKDLIGIPWRVAFALQADGWYLRSDIIWSKPNPMPESVSDRPTKAHEYIFLFSKSERYFYDADAIRERYAASTLKEFKEPYTGQARKNFAVTGAQNASDVKRRIVERQREANSAGANKRSVWTIPTQPFTGAHFAVMPERLAQLCVLAGSRPSDLILDPFLGSGTTARVAISLGRRAVGCDLQRSYLPLQRQRIAVTRGLPLEMVSVDGPAGSV